MPRIQPKLRWNRRSPPSRRRSSPCACSLFSTEFLKLCWRGGLSGRSPERPQRNHPLPPPGRDKTASQGGLSPVRLPEATDQARTFEATPYPLQASDSSAASELRRRRQGTHESAFSTRSPDAPVLSRSDGTGAGRGTRREPLLRAGRGGALGGRCRGWPLLRRGSGWQVTTHSIKSWIIACVAPAAGD